MRSVLHSFRRLIPRGLFALICSASALLVFAVWLEHPRLEAAPLNLQEAPPNSRSAWTLAPAAKKAQPSVVNIYTTKELRLQRNPLFDDPVFRRFFKVPGLPETQTQNSLGSGVIATPEGLILTNNHVVDSADQIEVALNDGRRVPAKVVGTDPETDLAVLKIEAKNLTPITWGKADTLQIGDFVQQTEHNEHTVQRP
jgi:serine protease DegQ